MTGIAQSQEAPRPAPIRVLVSWALTDWAAQPYYTLVSSFLFAPYFVTVVVGDPVQGQVLWGYVNAAAGVIVAVAGPILGAIADKRGTRKPWITFFSVIFVAGLLALWLAVPQAPASVIQQVLLGFVAATLAAEFTTIFLNAMMPSLVPAHQLGRLSGVGWAVGYLGGLISLGLVAGLIVSNPATGLTLFGLEPILPLDTASREGDRLVGPFSAAWYLLFMIPFFVYVPDVGTPAIGGKRRAAAAELWDTIRTLSSHRDMLLFLIANMFYMDGLFAIFTFGGIYGASVFGWGTLELGLFGIIVIFAGVFGAVIGGLFDDRAGSIVVIRFSLLLLIVSVIGILSVDKTHIFYTQEIAPKTPGSAPFSSIGEQVFLVFSVLIGVVAAPLQAASRTLCARLAPRDKVTQFFGLFAFSGKVTAFLAPFVIAAVTSATLDQRLGVASIIVFLILGMLTLLPVRERREA